MFLMVMMMMMNCENNKKNVPNLNNSKTDVWKVNLRIFRKLTYFGPSNLECVVTVRSALFHQL